MKRLLEIARAFLSWWFHRPRWLQNIASAILILIGLVLFFWGLIQGVGFPARTVGRWSAVVVWVLTCVIGIGAGYACWKAWPDRGNAFIVRTIMILHVPMVYAIGAVLLLFMFRGVRFTWKFSLTLFSVMLVADLLTMPMIFYIIRPSASKVVNEQETQSGALPPDFWQKEFRDAVRDTVKDEFLKP